MHAVAQVHQKGCRQLFGRFHAVFLREQAFAGQQAAQEQEGEYFLAIDPWGIMGMKEKTVGKNGWKKRLEKTGVDFSPY